MSRLIVLTGTAGFIGTHTAHALLDSGCDVLGIDAFTDSYSPADKRRNVATLTGRPGFRLLERDLADGGLGPVMQGADAVIHLAAQAGVTCSWGPGFADYARHNVLGTQAVLEGCHAADVPRLVAASSSSVYGDAPAYPCSEDARPHPVSPYGVTKLCTEHLCLAYAQPALGELSMALLRFFTVYGPRQRPDMAFSRFITAALAGRPVTVYGDGEQTRDFTYVSDVVQAIVASLDAPLKAEIFNVGGGVRTSVNDVLSLLGRILGRPVDVTYAPARAGDVRDTGSDCSHAAAVLGYRPQVDLATGLTAEVEWRINGDGADRRAAAAAGTT
ncbi:MAG: NAD-dependent epimerase/dehydratase family protein [Frankiaceae bacterium]